MPFTLIEDDEDVKQAPVQLPGAQLPMGQPAPQGGGLDLGDPNRAAITPPQVSPQIGGPAGGGFKPVDERSIPQKGWSRFWGTDVNDPMPWTRLASQLAGTLGGAGLGLKGGAAAGSLLGPAGAAAGGAIGGLVGGGAGALAGSVAPEMAAEAGELVGLLPEGYREQVGLTDDEMKTLLEGELILEIATGGGLTLARGVGRGLTRALTGPGRAGRELATEAARKFDIDLMPVQVGQRTLPRHFVNVMGQFPWVHVPMTRQASKIDEQIRTALDKLPLSIAPAVSSMDISTKALDDVKGLATRMDNYFGDLYSNIERRALAAGVRVQPANIISEMDAVREIIKSETPSAVGIATRQTPPGLKSVKTPITHRSLTTGKGVPTKALQEVEKFISTNLDTLRAVDPATGRTIVAPQSFKEMRGLSKGIDEKISQLVKEGVPYKDRSIQLLQKLRQAAQKDLLTRAVSDDPFAAAAIISDFRSVNEDFSTTIADLFETSAAKQFRSVIPEGVRGTGRGKATRIPRDNLAKILLRTESPQMAEELHRILQPETYRELTGNLLTNKIASATKTSAGTEVFNLDNFSAALGLGNKNSPRYKQMETMLRLSKSNTKMADLEKLVEVLGTAGSVNIPRMSQFVARRAALGGIRSMAGAVLPGSMVAGATASQTAKAGTLSMLMSAVGFIGGNRAIMTLLSKPENARPLRYVLNHEYGSMAYRRSMLKLFRGTMQEAGQEIQDPERRQNLEGTATELMREGFRWAEDFTKRNK